MLNYFTFQIVRKYKFKFFELLLFFYFTAIESSTGAPSSVDYYRSRCIEDGTYYKSGDLIPSTDICTECFCIEGKSVCAILECEAPAPRCIAVPAPEGKCCPDKYRCGEYQYIFFSVLD